MKRIAHSVLVAGLAALALGACTTNGMRGDTARTSGMDTGSSAGAMGSSGAGGTSAGTAGSMAGGTGGTATDQASQSGAMAGTPNSTVTNIEIIPRQGASDTGAGTVAGAAVGGSTSTGTTGGSMTSDRVYRITVRMDDGTTQMITQESTPAFSTGDRVRVAGGTIVR